MPKCQSHSFAGVMFGFCSHYMGLSENRIPLNPAESSFSPLKWPSIGGESPIFKHPHKYIYYIILYIILYIYIISHDIHILVGDNSVSYRKL